MIETDYSDKDELIASIVAGVLAKINGTDKPSLSWFELVSATNGKLNNPDIVDRANRLMDSIIISEFGSQDKYEKFLAKRQKQHDDYIKRIDRKQKQAEKKIAEAAVEPSPALPKIKAETPLAVKPDVKPSNPIANKIGVKRQNKTLEELVVEQGYESIEQYLFWNRNHR